MKQCDHVFKSAVFLCLRFSLLFFLRSLLFFLAETAGGKPEFLLKPSGKIVGIAEAGLVGDIGDGESGLQ